MPTMIVRHTVKDFDAWKPVYDENVDFRHEYGIRDAELFRDVASPNDVVIEFRVEDIARAEEFAASDALRETMQSAGVISKPAVWFLNEA
jgi:hypothetical protein